MYFVLAALVLALVALTAYTVRLAGKVNDIDEDVDELDESITSTFGDVGGYIGALIARVDRLEVQLGGAENSKAQAAGADVFTILDEAQAWAAANEPVPVVRGFVGFPQDYDPTYHFGGQQMFIPEGESKPSLEWGGGQQSLPKLGDMRWNTPNTPSNGG